MMKKAALTSEQAEQKMTGNDLLFELLDWLKYILLAVLIGLLLVVFVAQRNAVVGQSMAPTLQHNDQLFVEKVSKWFGGVDYGDIITVNTRNLSNHDGTANIIKRVVGMPGDMIEIKDLAVYRNGIRLAEDYLQPETVTRPRFAEFSSVKLADDQYYVMGDNRDISLDSRTFGPVNKVDIIGKVLLRFYPLNQLGNPE